MRKIATLIAGMVVIGSAHAAPVRPAGACTPSGAFGYRFGATAAEEANVSPDLPPQWAPFKQVRTHYTPRTNRLYQLTIAASIDTGSPAENAGQADALFQTLDAAVAATGAWKKYLDPAAQRVTEIDRNQRISSYWSRNDGKPGTLAVIQRKGALVELICRDQDLAILSQIEMQAEPPRIRPALPAVSFPARPAPDVCDNPGSRADVVVSTFSIHEKIQKQLLDLRMANLQLENWQSRRLIDRKGWTEQQQREFLFTLSQDPIVLAHSASSIVEILRPPSISRYMQLGGPNSEAVCRQALADTNQLFDFAEQSLNLWKHTQDLYDAEAKRLGVRWED